MVKYYNGHSSAGRVPRPIQSGHRCRNMASVSAAPYLFPFVCLLILLISVFQSLCFGAGLHFGAFIKEAFALFFFLYFPALTFSPC